MGEAEVGPQALLSAAGQHSAHGLVRPEVFGAVDVHQLGEAGEGLRSFVDPSSRAYTIYSTYKGAAATLRGLTGGMTASVFVGGAICFAICDGFT